MYLSTLNRFIFHVLPWFPLKFVQIFTTLNILQQGIPQLDKILCETPSLGLNLLVLLMPLPVGRVVNSPAELTAQTVEPCVKPSGKVLHFKSVRS